MTQGEAAQSRCPFGYPLCPCQIELMIDPACTHPSLDGIDQTPLDDPDKIWRCSACGWKGVNPMTDAAKRDEQAYEELLSQKSTMEVFDSRKCEPFGRLCWDAACAYLRNGELARVQEEIIRLHNYVKWKRKGAELKAIDPVSAVIEICEGHVQQFEQQQAKITQLQSQIKSLESQIIEQASMSNISKEKYDSEYSLDARLRKWFHDSPRTPAAIAFTAGGLRTAARIVWDLEVKIARQQGALKAIRYLATQGHSDSAALLNKIATKSDEALEAN